MKKSKERPTVGGKHFKAQREATERRKQDIRDRLDRGDRVIRINTHWRSGGQEIWESDEYPVYYKCYCAVMRERGIWK